MRAGLSSGWMGQARKCTCDERERRQTTSNSSERGSSEEVRSGGLDGVGGGLGGSGMGRSSFSLLRWKEAKEKGW